MLTINTIEGQPVIEAPAGPPRGGLLDPVFNALARIFGKSYQAAGGLLGGLRELDEEFSTLWWNTAQIPFNPKDVPKPTRPPYADGAGTQTDCQGANKPCVVPRTKVTLFQIDNVAPQRIDYYERAAQIVILVKDSSTIRFASTQQELLQAIGATQNGLALTSTNGPFPVFWGGELWAIGSAASSQFVLTEML